MKQTTSVVSDVRTLGRSRVARAIALTLIPATMIGASIADARITQFQINSRVLVAGGATFGSVGQYETITGVATGEVDPGDPRNAIITDIESAPRNANGNVEYSMDVVITKPVDMSKGNNTILHDVPNRGSIRNTDLNLGASATSVGDGFLEQQGYTLVDNGWEGDITSGLRITLPIATNPDGSPIIGRVRSEYIITAAASTMDVTAQPAYEAISTSNADATLTRRVHQYDAKELIPNSQWAFADCSTTAFPGVANTKKVCLQGGFDTNHIYELLYNAKNPVVMGLGFAATRDLNAWLRNSAPKGTSPGCKMLKASEPEAATGCPVVVGPSNPLGTAIKYAMTYGSSQSGRWIRTFIELGFNEDENGNRVFDGAIPHKSSNRGAFNVRWAQPTRLSGTQHTERQFPGAESPQTFETTVDTISGLAAGQLERCRFSHTCPKIFHTNTDTEYWQATMSLNTTDSLGNRDLPIAPEVRIYLFSATMHGGGDATAQPPTILPAPPVNCQLRANSNPFIFGQRALLVALRDWIVHGTQPPPSLYASLRDKTLVPVTSINYPYIPAVNFTPAGVATQKFWLGRGSLFDTADISGVMAEPPVPLAAYALLVPTIDADGNTIPGLRNTNVQVPLGTYLGSNVRKAGFSEGDSCDLTGSFIPFFKTMADRIAAGDPRPSLQERYPTHADYVTKITSAAIGLVAKRLMLPDDAVYVINQANAAAVP